MNGKFILDYLIQLDYEKEYICCAFVYGDTENLEWFLEEIKNPEYKYIRKTLQNKKLLDEFAKNCLKDKDINYYDYFNLMRVFDRACVRDYRMKRAKKYYAYLQSKKKVLFKNEKKVIKYYYDNITKCEAELFYVLREELGIKDTYKKERKLKCFYISNNELLQEIDLKQEEEYYYFDGNRYRDYSKKK